MRAILASLIILLAIADAAAQLPAPGQLCRAAVARAEQERGLPPHLLAAIARVESGRRDPQSGSFDPWPWAINAEGRGSFFPDKAAAIAAVRALQAQGVRSIDVGCLQVNLKHHPDAFASLEDAFDPLANARYGARFLAELQASRGDWMQSAGHYHSQTATHAKPYRARVATAWALEQGVQAPSPAALTAVVQTPAGGGAMLSHAADRAAAPPSGGAGRSLDAYRARPIPLAGRMPIVVVPGRL